MTAFSAPFGAGIAYGARVPSAGLNSINTDLPKAPNLVDGDATYSPLVGVTISGAGIFIGATGWRILSAAVINNYGGSFLGQAGISGLTATGGANAVGITATGGILAGGGVFTAGAGAGAGVTGTGSGTGAGGSFTGGASGNGVTAVGTSTGSGGVFTGGATGKGIVCDGGAASYPAIDIGVGNAVFTGAQPAATADPGADHYLCPTNICKAWAMVTTDGAGGATIEDGYNVASVTASASYVTVTFARAFASTNYAPVVTDGTAAGTIASTDYTTRTTTTVRVNFQAYGGGAVNPSSTIVRFALVVYGRQ